MDWLSQNWFFVLLLVAFVGMHLFGHGGHGGHTAVDRPAARIETTPGATNPRRAATTTTAATGVGTRFTR